jgi:hypothetical protein
VAADRWWLRHLDPYQPIPSMGAEEKVVIHMLARGPEVAESAAHKYQLRRDEWAYVPDLKTLYRMDEGTTVWKVEDWDAYRPGDYVQTVNRVLRGVKATIVVVD